jgi:hypothetical protein
MRSSFIRAFMRYLSSNDMAFRSKAGDWLVENGEISALIRFSVSAGNKSFEFFTSLSAFLDRLSRLPRRTCVTVFRRPQLPLRGRVDEEFVVTALEKITGGTEYLIAGLEPVTYGKMSWLRFMGGVGPAALREDLAEFCGEKIAFGAYPPWLDETGDVVSAIVPELDGSVVSGIY